LKVEKNEQMDKPLRDLIEIIHFTGDLSAKIHGLLDEAEIYRTVKEEFIESKKYTVTILSLTDDGSKLRIAMTSQPTGMLRAAERATGLRMKEYKIDLNKSSIFSQVVMGAETVQVNLSDLVGEFLPKPLAYLVIKIMGYEKKTILTPLYRLPQNWPNISFPRLETSPSTFQPPWNWPMKTTNARGWKKRCEKAKSASDRWQKMLRNGFGK